jgi:hypothetical protein
MRATKLQISGRVKKRFACPYDKEDRAGQTYRGRGIDPPFSIHYGHLWAQFEKHA